VVDPSRNCFYVLLSSGYRGDAWVYRIGFDGTVLAQTPTAISPPNGTRSTAIDSQGRIVTVSEFGDINRITFSDGGAVTVESLGLASRHGLLALSNQTLAIDGSDNVWILDASGTYGDGHNYITLATPSGNTDYLADDIQLDWANGTGAIYYAPDNSIIWATTYGLFKWSIDSKSVVGTCHAGSTHLDDFNLAGNISELVGGRYFLWGMNIVDARSLTIAFPHKLSDYQVQGDRTGFWHQYDPTSNSAFCMDAKCIVNQLDLGTMNRSVADIDGDANPALAIYDLLTHPVYGLRKPASLIDQASFDSAARTLFDEGLGISMNIDTPTSADELIGEILRHADGVLYNDPQTGLYTLKLARADYDPESLPVLSVDDVLEPPQYSRGSWSETTNEVKITFTDRSSNWEQNVSPPAQDTANIAILGTLNSETIDFKGLSNMTTATLVAARALKTLSSPLARLTVKTNRKAWKLRPGGCFRFTWEPLGIDDEVFRVARIGYGKVDEGTITIDAVEDIFGLSTVAFSPPGGSGWIDPSGLPNAPLDEVVLELPYQLLPTTTAEERVGVGIVRADSRTTGLEVWTDDGSGYRKTNESGFAMCPSGVLASDYLRTTPATDATGMILVGGVDLRELLGTDATGLLAGDCLLRFEDDSGELCAYQTATANGDGAGSVTIGNIVRGVYDTFPADHAQGTRVVFIRDARRPFLCDAFPDTKVDTSGDGDQFLVVAD